MLGTLVKIRLFSSHNKSVGGATIFISKMRELKHREVKKLTEVHPGGKC